jgi:hypothetical protein
MHHRELHRRLGEIVPGVLAHSANDPMAADVAAMDEHASAGCTLCARALVNAREVLHDLAVAGGRPGSAPPAALRTRILAASRRPAVAGRVSERRREEPPRALDPSGAVAHHHVGGADESARIAEVDRLEAMIARDDDGLEGLLAQLQRILQFPLLFVSIVRGSRVGYRVQRGLPPEQQAAREIRREMSFCTHCVSAGGPLVVPNAPAEPFFRGSKMVVRYGMGAYVGVPLRASSGIIIGTLCALDYEPHAIAEEDVGSLELFGRRVLGAIEGDLAPSSRSGLALPRGMADEAWLDDLLALEITRASRGRASALIGVRGSAPIDARVLALAAPDEVIGSLGEDAVGVLLSGANTGEAQQRAAELRSGLDGVKVRVAVADPAASVARWRAGALGDAR